MPSMCKLTQHFEFHSGTSSLTITSISKDAPFVQNLDGLMDKKFAPLFTSASSGGWKSGKNFDDVTFLQCLSSIREKGWTLMCNDIVNAEAGFALRTFFFETNNDLKGGSLLADAPNPTAPSNGLDNTKMAEPSSWASVASSPPPPTSAHRRISYSDLGNSQTTQPASSKPPFAPPPPPPPAPTVTQTLPPPPAPTPSTSLPPPPPAPALPPRSAPSPPTPQATPPPPPVAVARTAPPLARPAPPPVPVLTAEQKAEKERNAEFIRLQVKEKEEKEAAKQKALNKLTPEEREELEAQEKAATAHEENKTRHFARLGRLAGGGAKQQMGGRGGRGNQRGRGR